jgi:hypothetical protein
VYQNLIINRVKALKTRNKLRNLERSEVDEREEIVGRSHITRDVKEGVNQLINLEGDEIDLAL